MINLKEGIKKGLWLIPAAIVGIALGIIYLRLRARDKSKEMFEEYLKP